MGKIRKMEREQAERQKKKQQKRNIIWASALICVAIGLIIWLIISQQTTSNAISVAPDDNGDLRVLSSSLSKDLNYIDYGADEEIIFWKDGSGVIRTAFDTCETCYPAGDAHFTLNRATLACSACGTTQPVSVLGTASWGGCQPISIIPEIRADTEGEVVIPAAVLAYAKQMFSRWDASDFSVTFATYETAE